MCIAVNAGAQAECPKAAAARRCGVAAAAAAAAKVRFRPASDPDGRKPLSTQKDLG